jgi:hypothetical protein
MLTPFAIKPQPWRRAVEVAKGRLGSASGTYQLIFAYLSATTHTQH